MQRLMLVWVLLLGLWPSLPAQSTRSADETISLEDLWLRYRYYPRPPNEFRWMADDNFYSLLENEAIVRYSVATGEKVDEVVDFSDLDLKGIAAKDIASYEFSADESKVLLKASVESIYRRSRRQVCLVVDLASKQTLLVHDGEKVTNPTFSPQGDRLGYVFENNLYLTPLIEGEQKQVTFDGERNAIINGLTDWVYEEEFAIVQAFAFSPDGQRVAYYRFDESEVKQFTMPLYNGLYPEQYTFKYPKAGEANSLVTLHIYDLKAEKTVQIDLGPETDQYIPRIKWTQSSDELALMRLNRLQNQVDVMLANAVTGETKVILTETSDTYISEATDDKWFFLEESEDFIWTSEESGYNHIYRYNRAGEKVATLTAGEWEVTSIVGIDEANDRLYFMSTEASPLERQLYAVSLQGKGKQRLTSEAGTHRVKASGSFSYFIDTYSSTEQVPVSRLLNSQGETVKVLTENQALASRVAKLDIATPEFIEVPLPEGPTLNGYMIKPSDFDESKQYPVLMFVYGGPGSQQVMNAWGHGSSFNYMWFQMLAQQGYLVACVDNRGTGGRGQEFRACTYADLGNLETRDQVAAAQYLGDLPYVDAERIGIWGWSYGGYMTSLCLTKGGGVFKAGIAVAPVTNWRFYDTIYTERYLKRPQDNPAGYDGNSPINYAGDLEGNYLLVHGTADDNVHFQNSIEWVNALVEANKQFDTFFYPNKAHGISGGITRYHLYNKMTQYLLENL